jgi:hypothetical protein
LIVLPRAAFEDEVKARLAAELPAWYLEEGWIRRKVKTNGWKHPGGTNMLKVCPGRAQAAQSSLVLVSRVQPCPLGTLGAAAAKVSTAEGAGRELAAES